MERPSYKVAIVGAGVSGVVAARVFKSEGFNVTVLEANSSISGVWSKGYPGASIQTTGWLYEFPDKPLPSPKDYISGPRLQSYTEEYAKEHGVMKIIKLNTKVSAITRAPDNKWQLTTVALDDCGLETTTKKDEVFDFVVLATGVYSPCHKFTPTIPGINNFKGECYHSVDTAGIKNRKGKKVVIVGFGKSAQDCAMNALYETGVAPILLFRSSHWCVPRKILGLIPMEWLLYSRFGQGTLPCWMESGPVETVVHTALYPIIFIYWRIVELILTLQLGMWGSGSILRPWLSIEEDMYCGHGIIAHPSFFPLCHSKKIIPLRDEIKTILPSGAIELVGGSIFEVDEIVFATGFHRHFEFFPKEINDKKEEDGFYTYRNMLVPGVPNIAFLNNNAVTFSNITTPGLQARWLVEVIKGNVAIPKPEDMAAIVDKEKAWRRKHLKHAGEARAYFIQLHQTRYWDTLLRDIGANIKRKRSSLGPVVASLLEFFEPNYSAGYKDVVTGHWKDQSSEVCSPGYKPTFAFEWFNFGVIVAVVVLLVRFYS